MHTATLINALDLIGTLVFALSGALVGARRGADLFGVLVLGFVTAVAGGIMRDVVLGAIPPAALASWHMLALSVAAGLVAFYLPAHVDSWRRVQEFFDAAGLGVFAVTGTQKALEYGLTPLMAAVLGMVSGIGGGMLRDVLTAQVPIVLRSEIYGIAALAAGLTVALGHIAAIDAALTSLVGIGICLFLRLMAVYRGWNLPIARGADRTPDQ